MICTYRNVYFLSCVVKYHAAHLRQEIGANLLKGKNNFEIDVLARLLFQWNTEIRNKIVQVRGTVPYSDNGYRSDNIIKES